MREFLANSPYAKYAYADWTCDAYRYGNTDHDIVQDTYGNVITKHCRCGKPFTEHHEIEIATSSVVGHPDLLLLIDGVFHIREFKSYDRSDIPFDSLTEVLPSHRMQVSCYRKLLYILAKSLGYTVSKYVVVEYIDRSNSKLFGGKPYKSFECEVYPDRYMDRIKNSIDHFELGVKTGKLPDRICPKLTARRAVECDNAVECFLRRNKYVERQDRELSYKGFKPKVYNRSGRGDPEHGDNSSGPPRPSCGSHLHKDRKRLVRPRER